jgi:phosphate-selective porin OprO/OprP
MGHFSWGAGYMRSLAAVSLLLPLISIAADPAPPPTVTILIENVRLIDNDAEQDPIVNILIRNNKLDLVTPDAVPIAEFTLKVDAKGGHLLGALELGKEPSFLILDADPRKEFDVLLDTKTHVNFAVEDGQIVRNRLLATAAAPTLSEPGKKGSGWLAYEPPPLSLPTQYTNTSKWNRWDTKYVDGLFLGIVALDRMAWTSQDDASEAQVGNVKDFNGGDIRALRFGVVGTLNFDKPWVYTVFATTSAFDKGFDESRDDSFQWFDVRLDIPVIKNTTLSIGKQKEPISMERITSLIFDPMQERPAPIDAMLPARNVGAVWSGNAVGTRMSWAAGVFNPWLDTDESISDTSSQLVGRLTGVPWQSADASNLIHLGAGLRYSNAKSGVRYFTEPEFNESPIYVDTGDIEADNAYTWDIEASWRKGPIWLSSEFLRTKVDSPLDGDLNFSGYHVSGVWSLSGEMRSYNTRAGVFNRPPVAKSVYQKGWGAWELMARYSYTDLTDRAIDGGEMDIWSVGARWWLTYFLSLDMNYRSISLDRFGVTGDSRGFNTRLLISLE